VEGEGDELRNAVKAKFGNIIEKPAKDIENSTRQKIVDYLKQKIEPGSISWLAESGFLDRKGLLINGNLVAESELHMPCERREGLITYLTRVFNSGKPRIKLNNPACTIRQSGNFNRINFMERLLYDNCNLTNKRFGILIEYKKIPKWYLPLVVIQPYMNDKGVETSIYCVAHKLYHGLDDFHVGKIFSSIAEEVGGRGGGLKTIGSLSVSLSAGEHALSLLGVEFKEKIPRELTYGKFPDSMLRNARKLICNPKLYERYS